MDQFESVNCIICRSNDLHLVAEKGQFDLPTYVNICKNCGLSFLNPRWTAAKYLDFYRREYDKYYRADEKAAQGMVVDNYSYYPILKRLQKQGYLEDDRTIQHILDIGSGNGKGLSVFHNKLREASYYAIEPSLASLKTLESRDIKVVANDVNADWDADYENTFDFVIMRHVLEHFLDPLAVLKKIKRVMDPGAILYIAVPNALKIQGPLNTNFFRAVHIYYFNRVSLTNLLHMAGLEINMIQEGDDYNQGELFLLAKCSNRQLPVTIDPANYFRQLDSYQKRLDSESTFRYQAGKIWEEIKNLITSPF